MEFSLKFPKWCASLHRVCRTAPGRSRVFCPERRLWSRKRLKLGESACKPAASRPSGDFFCASGKLVVPLSFSFGLDRGRAHKGGARNRRMPARLVRTIASVTATSASWNVMARA